MFCVNCGSKLETGSNFCSKCGTKIVCSGTDDVTAAETTAVQLEQDMEYNYKRGKECFDGGVYKVAFQYFQKAANLGHIEAQYRLAQMYQKALGVAESNKYAVQWYAKAAMQGHAGAQYMLALQYLYGKGMEQDFVSAFKWLTRSSEQGFGNALYTLGKQYEGDLLPEEFLPRDIEKAKELYRKAIDLGSKEAVINLATLEYRTQASESKLTNDQSAFVVAISDYFRKISSLAKKSLDIKHIHVSGISTDFEQKLSGASTYARLEKNEIPLVVIDSTIWGSAKKGALFTTSAIYMNGSDSPLKVIGYQNVQSVSLINARAGFYKITVNGNWLDYLIRNEYNARLLRDFLKNVVFSLQT